MAKMRFHLLGLAHIETTKENSSCAYTQKIIKLANMIKKFGHTIYFYGVEGSQVACDEFIQVSSQSLLRDTYGEYDRKTLFFKCDPNDKAHTTFNENAIKAINENKKAGDVLLCTMGVYQKSIADATKLLCIESGIGYSGVFSDYKVFESYAWMHYIYGRLGADDGNWYDAVIPNFFNVDEFSYRDEKEDYLLYFGRIINRKGVQTASDVAKATGNKLMIVGQGSLDNPQENLHLGNEKHIEYRAAVGTEERAELLSRAKAVLMPTYYLEPFGGVNVEAQLSGTPVITTDWGAFPETVLHGVTGYRCRTFEEFCWGVNNISEIKPSDCRRWAVENFSTDRVGEMYEEYFQRIYRLFGEGWYEKNEERNNLNWLRKYYV